MLLREHRASFERFRSFFGTYVAVSLCFILLDREKQASARAEERSWMHPVKVENQSPRRKQDSSRHIIFEACTRTLASCAGS